jgi:hypothetical protein
MFLFALKDEAFEVRKANFKELSEPEISPWSPHIKLKECRDFFEGITWSLFGRLKIRENETSADTEQKVILGDHFYFLEKLVPSKIFNR